MHAKGIELTLMCSLAASLAPAQGWSILANAPATGSASVMLGASMTQTASLPLGPVAPGQFLACSQTSGGAAASVAATWSPSVPGQVAPLAFTAATLINFQGIGTTTLSAQLDLTLRAPQPTGGRLWVRFLAGGTMGSLLNSAISLDVAADGSIEFIGVMGGLNPGPVDIPIQIPAAGAVVRVRFGVFAQSYQSPYITTGVVVEAQFFPGEPAVHTFDTIGAHAWIGIDHGFGGTVTLTIGNPSHTPVLLAFGAQPVQVPILPTVTLCVTLDAIYPVGPLITLPLPPLAPGTAIYCQGLVLDSIGTPRSTNSVRALWP